jgi:hypothetical protein
MPRSVEPVLADDARQREGGAVCALLRKLGFVFLLPAFFSHPALAATIVVDETTCTLVDAITAANTDTAVGGCAAGSGADTIELTTDVILTEVNNDDGEEGDNGLPVVETDITIEGGEFTIERDADAPPFRLFLVNATLSLNEVVLRNGWTPLCGINDECCGEGGGILNQGILNLTDSTVSDNGCGGISNIFGTAMLTNTVISQNSGSGISNFGTLKLTDCTVSDNGGSHGGGILNAGTLELTNSTVSDNSALHGGGISNSGALELTNSTVSGNVAHISFPFDEGRGGGILNWSDAPLTLTNSTVSGNSADSAGGGIEGDNWTTIFVANSIVANNEGNCCISFGCNGGAVIDNGNNFADDDTCGPGFADITPDVDFDTNLADNGGPTQTHALLSGSVAINAAGDCGLETDQRGFPRDGCACDSGSFEFQGGGDDGCGDVPASSPLGLLALVLLLLTITTAVLWWRWRLRA